MAKAPSIIPVERVAAQIYLIRGQTVMFDADLAALYGVAMLSSVLKSKRAVEVNITIVRTFVRLRRMLASNEDLARKVAQHDRQIAVLFEHVKHLLEPPPAPKKPPIGFIHPKG